MGSDRNHCQLKFWDDRISARLQDTNAISLTASSHFESIGAYQDAEAIGNLTSSSKEILTVRLSELKESNNLLKNTAWKNDAYF